MSKPKASAPRVFVPLFKVDEEQRLVYGRITQEELDKSGEVMDYDTSKPNFEKWSNDIHTASNGLSKGNVRVMHGLNVAGKLTEIEFDDESKAIDVCAKVVDDGEWEKVLEGCYTGFSVGGKYGKRWKDNGMQKYTAIPNEVSLVDNPCVGSATFSLVKADGATEDVMFKATAAEDKPEEKPAEQGELPVVTNEQVVAKAEEIAKAANDGTSWMDHVTTARDQLIKAAADAAPQDENPDTAPPEETPDADAVEEPAEGDKAEKVTPAGVKQVWTASDGKTFEKKADAEAHEATLTKAAAEPTEAEKLAARLKKALSGEPDPEPVSIYEDFDRLGKAINALSTPFGEDGKPKLEKGMYTVNRFSSVLSDMAALSRTIKKEGTREGDTNDSTISAEIIAAVKSLGASFITYATEQVQELLAGMDDDVVVTYYDYYYNAAKSEGEDAMAKDVCALIDEHRDPSRELRGELSKAFGIVSEEVPELSEELSPPMQKRFDTLEAENAELKKVAGEAVEKVEELAKKVQELADQPMPRAPGAITALFGGDGLAKSAPTEAEKLGILEELVKTHGADGVATMLIKAAHATGGHKLQPRGS